MSEASAQSFVVLVYAPKHEPKRFDTRPIWFGDTAIAERVAETIRNSSRYRREAENGVTFELRDANGYSPADQRDDQHMIYRYLTGPRPAHTDPFAEKLAYETARMAEGIGAPPVRYRLSVYGPVLARVHTFIENAIAALALPNDWERRDAVLRRGHSNPFVASELISLARSRGELTILEPRIRELKESIDSLLELVRTCPQIPVTNGVRQVGHLAPLMRTWRALEWLEQFAAAEQDERIRAIVTMPMEPPATSSIVPTAQSRPEKKSWTQGEVDRAIREYANAIKRKLNAAKRMLRKSEKDAKKAARKVFGRNMLAAKLGCAKAMVSNSQPWQTIADMLGIRGDTPGRIRGDRIGLNQAIEQSSEEEIRRLKAEQEADEACDMRVRRSGA